MNQTPIEGLVAELDGLAAGIDIQLRKAKADLNADRRGLGPLLENLADTTRRDRLQDALDALEQVREHLVEADL